MPEIDLTPLYERIEPWDCRITLGKEKLRVRRLDSADMAALGRLDAGRTGNADAVKFITNLFEKPQPNVTKWDGTKAGMILRAIIAYYHENVVKKKLDATAAEVARQLATNASTGGNS